MNSGSNALRWFILALTVIIGSLGISPAFSDGQDSMEYQLEENYWESCSYIWERRSYDLPPEVQKRIEKLQDAHPSPYDLPSATHSRFSVIKDY